MKRIIIVGVTIVLCGGIIFFNIKNLMPIPIEKYSQLLALLKEYDGNFTIVHDCDYNVHGLPKLIDAERRHNLTSFVFVRPHQDYFLTWLPYFQRIESEGWIIGFHYNSLSRADGDLSVAKQYFSASLAFLRTFLNISYVRGHGDSQYRIDVSNRLPVNFLISENTSEIDVLNFDTYVRDTDKNLVIPSLRGKILVNIHSDWW